MRRRAVAAALAVALAACGQGDGAGPEAGRVEVADAADAPRVPCARGTAPLELACTVEQARGEGGLTLTLRHADGAFRRLLVATDGRGVVAADGAEPARVSVAGANEIEVAVAGERYRLPATVQGPAPSR